jgi:hypothetical protein
MERYGSVPVFSCGEFGEIGGKSVHLGGKYKNLNNKEWLKYLEKIEV